MDTVPLDNERPYLTRSKALLSTPNIYMKWIQCSSILNVPALLEAKQKTSIDDMK